MANSNILNVGGKINNYRDEAKYNTNENVQVLHQLRDQIDHRLTQQNLVNSKLTKHIKDLSKSVTNKQKRTPEQPILLPHHHTYPMPSHRQVPVASVPVAPHS